MKFYILDFSWANSYRINSLYMLMFIYLIHSSFNHIITNHAMLDLH